VTTETCPDRRTDQAWAFLADLEALRGKRLLVTGAAGFIGGALLRRLAAHGLEVVGTALHEEEVEALRAEGLTAERLDLAAEDPFEPLLEGVDVVLHIAAMFQETEHGEAMYHKVNADGALKLCRAAAACGVRRFVHCSTVGVHGHVKEIPCRETSPFNPMDLYHRTKLAGELAILDFARGLPADGMVVTVNRPAMVYGPGDMRMLKLFRAVLGGRFVMIGKGETLAHLGHIDDQVESLVRSAVAPRARAHLEAFNIASDRPLTLNELVRTIAQQGGVRAPRLRLPLGPIWLAAIACETLFTPLRIRPPLSRRRVGFFTHDRAFDLGKARERLCWVPRRDHASGIAETIAWYRARGLVPARA
jgi:nucleoside-diphosphate-sugar epimerase